MIKEVTPAHLEPIGYHLHSEPSDVTYAPNQFVGWDFFAFSYTKTALNVELQGILVGFSRCSPELETLQPNQY